MSHFQIIEPNIRMKKYYFSLIIIFFISLIKPYSINAQITDHDTSYYLIYPNTITLRFYFSKKYTAFTFPASGDAKNLQYRPNTKLTTGIGVTYHNLSLNVSYGFGFLNPHDERGKTKSIDLQLHLYPKKWAIDALGLFHKGFYAYPKGYAASNSDSYYYRPDFKMNIIGLAAYRVLNAKRFSYNAAMIQNEWQKKSAGTFLLGGEAYYGIIKADSTLVPKEVEQDFSQAGSNKINLFGVGIGVGYAYTLVIQKHIFITGSLIPNLDFTFSSKEKLNEKDNKAAVNSSLNYKAAIGYNSNTWNVSANWTGNLFYISGALSSKRYFLPIGNYRLILAKKIELKRRT